MTARSKPPAASLDDQIAEARAMLARLRRTAYSPTSPVTAELEGRLRSAVASLDAKLRQLSRAPVSARPQVQAFLRQALARLRLRAKAPSPRNLQATLITLAALGLAADRLLAEPLARTRVAVTVRAHGEGGEGVEWLESGSTVVTRGGRMRLPDTALEIRRFDTLRPGGKVGIGVRRPRRGQRAMPPADGTAMDIEIAAAESTPASADGRLHFVLQGDHVKGAAIVAGTEAVLEFRFGVPGDQSIGVVDSERLDDARKADVDIELRVTPRGPIEVVGSRSGVAHFAQGRLLAPVPFALKAGVASEDGASLHVDFSVKGEVVHQMELALDVVASAAQLDSVKEKAGTYDAPSALVGDAGTVGEPPRQRISLSLSIVGGKFCMEVTDLIDGEIAYQEFFESKAIDRARLEILLNSVRADLGPAYRDLAWAQYDGSVPPAEQAAAIAAPLRRTVDTVAVAGSRLNKDLRSDEAIARALQYIEDNGADGAVITVATDDVFIPWEILYPGLRTANMTQAQKDANPVEPKRFWGARFAIETVQRGTGSLRALRNAQLVQPPTVSVNLNPTISMKDLDAASQPLAVQRAWAQALGVAKQLDGVQDSCVDMRDVLQNAGKDATVIYLYCHGRSPNPFGGVDEVLELDDDCPLGPNDLDAGPAYKNAPIIVLNACEAGVYSTLTFSSFLRAFRKRQALGLVATTFSIPIVFGAHFGQSLVKALLDRKGSLAGMLLDLRREYLLQRGNPVPLFYSVQCQMDYSAKGGTP